MRDGPGGINADTVARTAAGLARFLRGRPRPTAGAPDAVVGFDARHSSSRFARECASVLAGAGLRVELLSTATPTPVLAFAVRARDAAAGVMITASHNPAGDNGLKVYLGGPPDDPGSGAQLVSPDDGAIETEIRAVADTASLPRSTSTTLAAEAVIEEYLDRICHLAIRSRDIRVAFTPLHGVGGEMLQRVFGQAGFPAPTVVGEQADPDPDFPTVRFPNPEEPGALDRLRRLLDDIGADLGLALDPDADRCAAVVPTPDGLRMLTGDEVGILLGDAVLRTSPGPVATTVVSATALPALAARYGVPCHRTLTGFKWLMRSDPRLVFAYEEALGYAVRPDVVRDKDGISAALLLAAVAAELAERGRSLPDRLDEIAADIGLHVTRGVSVRLPSGTHPAEELAALRTRIPRSLGGHRVEQVSELPDAAGLVLELDGDGSMRQSRVTVRPSGTEPKLKAYLELVRDTGPEPSVARQAADRELSTLARAVAELLQPGS
jgi:phosphomannomutase